MLVFTKLLCKFLFFDSYIRVRMNRQILPFEFSTVSSKWSIINTLKI